MLTWNSHLRKGLPALLLLPILAVTLDNGVARTPILGYNMWNHYKCEVNQDIVKMTADAMLDLGLVDLGYNYLNLDDCWHDRYRDRNGQLQSHPVRFSNGIKALGDYVHSKGLKFGIYSDSGFLTCQLFPGSRGHEEQDAKTFADWGVDYLKYDNCWSNPLNNQHRYTVMRDALLATGRPIVYSMCNWGVDSPWLWGMETGNSWRVGADINPDWPNVLYCLDTVKGLSKYGGPGGWNDPDMLEVGNGGLTLAQQRSHFALWALVKSPLLIGAPLDQIKEESLQILKNKEILALNQDPLGVPGDMVWGKGSAEVWVAPLEGGDRGVILFHRGLGGPLNISLSWAWMGYEDQQVAEVRELYGGRNLGTFQGSITLPVAPCDVQVLRIVPRSPTKRLMLWRPWWEVAVKEEMKRRDRSRELSQREALAHMKRVRGGQPTAVYDVLATEGTAELE